MMNELKCRSDSLFAFDAKELPEVVNVLKALADPQRLRILDLLLQGDSCNCELHDRLGLSANLLSHHLKVLREAGLVTSRNDTVDARWVYYSIDPPAIDRWRDWLFGFLDASRFQPRSVLCGPEGKLTAIPSGEFDNK